MKEIDQIKEVLILTLNWQIRNTKHPFDVEELEGIKKGILNLNQPIEPTQSEGYQGLNKWYLTNELGVFYPTELNKGILSGYGLRGDDNWDKTFVKAAYKIKRLATESEIKEAILKGCEQHGMVEGAVVKCMTNKVDLTLEFNEVDFINNELWIDGVCNCFKNGKFADVVQNFDCEDGYCTKQCDKCKDSFEVVKEDKPTDKELLKECTEYFNDIINNEKPYTSKLYKLLVKLNKHLNHE